MCLREMLKEWLKKDSPESPWEELTAALASTAVGEQGLAGRLRTRYCSGRRTVRTDAKQTPSEQQSEHALCVCVCVCVCACVRVVEWIPCVRMCARARVCDISCPPLFSAAGDDVFTSSTSGLESATNKRFSNEGTTL